jgi:hypothetical protein
VGGNRVAEDQKSGISFSNKRDRMTVFEFENGILRPTKGADVLQFFGDVVKRMHKFQLRCRARGVNNSDSYRE